MRDDLIRRGDALASINNAMNNATGDLYDAYSAIAALPAVTPRVKPLVWEARAGKYKCDSECPIGLYEIYQDGSWIVLWFNGFRLSGAFPSIEAAKAAAQADYEARILAALDMQPAPDMRRLIKDAERRGQIKAGAIFANYGTNEDDYAAAVHNACPHCNGSGHKDDVKPAPDAQTCPKCGSKHFAVPDELQANGCFAPGNKRRCVECKTVYAPAPDAQAIRDAALREARQRVNDLVAERQADLHGARNDFNRGAVDAVQEACSAILALIGTTAEGGA